MHSERRVNRLRIVSYHYSDFGELRFESESRENSRGNGESKDVEQYPLRFRTIGSYCFRKVRYELGYRAENL